MDYKDALERAAALCSRQEYSAFDIRRKLDTWGLEEADAQRLVEQLVKERFIDEERYAEYFTKDKYRLNKWGKVKIRFALRQKQLPDKVINAALDTIPAKEYREICASLLKQKAQSLKNENFLKKKAKLVAFAAQRGFESDLVYELVDILLKDK